PRGRGPGSPQPREVARGALRDRLPARRIAGKDGARFADRPDVASAGTEKAEERGRAPGGEARPRRSIELPDDRLPDRAPCVLRVGTSVADHEDVARAASPNGSASDVDAGDGGRPRASVPVLDHWNHDLAEMPAGRPHIIGASAPDRVKI